MRNTEQAKLRKLQSEDSKKNMEVERKAPPLQEVKQAQKVVGRIEVEEEKKAPEEFVLEIEQEGRERIMEKYKSESKHSIYYLRPDSPQIYFLDFKRKKFCPEIITFAENRAAKSAQGS